MSVHDVESLLSCLLLVLRVLRRISGRQLSCLREALTDCFGGGVLGFVAVFGGVVGLFGLCFGVF